MKLCQSPEGDEEVYILCRSSERREKEEAMHRRFELRIEKELQKIEASCERRKWKKEVIDGRIGSVMAKNSRAAGLFEVDVQRTADGRATISWEKKDAWRDWAKLSKINMVDVVLPTRCGVEIRRRCITQPTDHQAILLQRMGLHLPRQKKD